MKTNLLKAIDEAETFDKAMSLTSHHDRLKYIALKKGYRAIGGRFNPTRQNVLAKFSKVWSEETGKPNSRR